MKVRNEFPYKGEQSNTGVGEFQSNVFLRRLLYSSAMNTGKQFRHDGENQFARSAKTA
ncbi:MAG: hypothetical protein M3525_01070 [Acidobacteriota bacterium]|nr:hypothetical protein [Acidobacteriota bacterium]